MRTIARNIFVNPAVLLAAVFFHLANPGGLLAQEFVGYAAAGINAAAIQNVVDAFRTAVGNPNNGNAPGPLPSGRREINWDGGGAGAAATTFPVPMTTFNTAPLSRGAVFTTPGTGFEISGQPTPEFGDLNATYPVIFTPFSAPRLFASLGSTITDVHFFRPGTDIPATTSAFGAIFTDVDLAATTSVEYFNSAGESIAKIFAPPADNGLSFVGLVSNSDRVALVRIISGNTAAGPAENPGVVDVVVMDDFIYGEPLVGPPADADACKQGGWAEFEFPRVFKNQGDCVKFVKTGK
jgi:hypothetical protein